MDQLQDLYQHTNEDTASRLKSLEIEKEIQRIKNGGIIETYTPIQIFESLDLCLRNGKDLMNDFRQVEDNFRQDGAEIYKKQSELNYSKGDILGFALDTDEKLRQSPQGQSFDAFWKYIAEDYDNEINMIVNSIIEKVLSTTEINQLDNIDTDFLLNFKRNLFEAGSKIIDTKKGITDKLSRILQQNQNSDYHKLNSVINNIKKLASEKYAEEDYENQKNFMMFDTKANVSRAFSPVLPNMQTDLDEIEEFDSSEIEYADFEDLLNQFYVDRNKLIQNIKEYRNEYIRQFTLAELLEEYLLTKGMAELAVYYDLLNSEKGMTIDEESKQETFYEKNGQKIKVIVPKMIIEGKENV